MLSVFSVVAVALLSGVQHVAAVCNPDQLAIGFVTFSENDGSTSFAGFEMTPDCVFISKTPTTNDPDQYCKGVYTHSAAVLCGQDGFPNLAIDPSGNTWQCNDVNSDTSCDNADQFGPSKILVCCDKLPPE